MNIGQEVIANIITGPGTSQPRLVRILGWKGRRVWPEAEETAVGAPWYRIEMIDACEEVDLPVGAQTILDADRF